jgi:hypothetical protein
MSLGNKSQLNSNKLPYQFHVNLGKLVKEKYMISSTIISAFISKVIVPIIVPIIGAYIASRKVKSKVCIHILISKISDKV